jgi:hypothetical protein
MRIAPRKKEDYEFEADRDILFRVISSCSSVSRLAIEHPALFAISSGLRARFCCSE